MTAQEAELIYQQARQSLVATQTTLPKISLPTRKWRGRTAIFQVEGTLPEALKARFAQFGFVYRAKDSVLELPVGQWRGEALDFMLSVRGAKTLADLGLDPAEHTARVERTRQARANQRAQSGDMDTLQNAVKKTPVLAHHDLAVLYGRLATGLLGKPCRVKLERPAITPGNLFPPPCRYNATEGVFYADPYPLGETAPARENLVVTRMGIERELAWQKHTPPEIIATAQAMAAGNLPDEGLDSRGRQLVPAAYGLIERARAERMWLGNNAGLVKGAYAARQLKPEWRWTGKPRQNPDGPEHITGALTMLAVPFGELDDEQWGSFSPNVRRVLKKLEPVVAQAVRGTPEDAYRAALVVARELQATGLSLEGTPILPDPPKGTKPVNLMRRCPHCQSFLSRDGQCHNPRCPGPKPPKPARENQSPKAEAPAPAKPKPKSKDPAATTDARAQLVAELRKLEQENAKLRTQIAQQDTRPTRASAKSAGRDD